MDSEYEVYGLSLEEWEALTDEERAAYRNVGSEENMASQVESATEEVVAENA